MNSIEITLFVILIANLAANITPCRIICNYINEAECLANSGIYLPASADGGFPCCSVCLRKLSKGDPCGTNVPDGQCDSGLICDPELLICVVDKKCPVLCQRVRCARFDPRKCLAGFYSPPDGDCNCCGYCKVISRPDPLLVAKV